MTEPLLDMHPDDFEVSPESDSERLEFQDPEFENREIQERFRAELSQRGQRSPFSPSFLNSQPRSALEKHNITAEQEEQILYLYAGTYSLHQTASSCGVSLEKVRAVVYSPDSTDRIAQFREEMKISVLQKMEETQVVLLDSIQDPDKLKNASITQISEVFTDIAGVQSNLIASIQESQSAIAHINPEEAFSGEELEYMMLLRRRLSIGASPDAPETPNLDAPLDAIETDFVQGESVGLDDPELTFPDETSPEPVDEDD